MTKQPLLGLILAILVLCLGFAVVTAQDTFTGSVIPDRLNVRAAPDATGALIGELARGTEVTIEGRNRIGDWILVHTADNAVRGWAASRFVDFGGNDVLILIPVVDEIINAPPSVAPPAEGGETPQDEAPPAEQPETPREGGVMFPNGTTIDGLNVRTGPGVDYEAMTRLPVRARVIIEGRNTIGDWIIVRTIDNSIRGWVASRYVQFDEGLLLGNLEVLPNNLALSGQDYDSGNTVGIADTPAELLRDLLITHTDYAAMQARLENTPLLYNMTAPQVYTIYRRGLERGMRPNVFMKVGDSMTAEQAFLWGFGLGQYHLGPYGHLQAVIDFFSVPPHDGEANSFTNVSWAAQTGFTSGAVFNAYWVDPEICYEYDEYAPPLYCEYYQIQPAVAIILFGSQDVRVFDTLAFQVNIEHIVRDLSLLGVIPVLNTFPSHPDSDTWEKSLLFNTLILEVANLYGVPVINLWRASRNLPDYGISGLDGFHLSNGYESDYSFNGAEGVYGTTLRNLLTLQALDELRRNVLQ